jgi:hypothetical protein
MFATLFASLLLCLDSPSPPVIRLERGQEITWKGTFREEMLRPGVTASRNYSFENRLFVLESHEFGYDVAISDCTKAPCRE